MLSRWYALPPEVQARLSYVHDEMCRALNEEMRAQDRAPVPLPIGVRLASMAGCGDLRPTYRFAMPAPREVKAGDAVLCRLPSGWEPESTADYWATVVAASSTQFAVAFRHDLGSQIPAGGVYIPKESVGLVDVQVRLRRIEAGYLAFNARLALQLLGEHDLASTLPPAPAMHGDAPRQANVLAELNEAQIDAVQAFLERDFAVLWGPPGTGKTSVLAHGIALRAEQPVAPCRDTTDIESTRRPRILVVAPSNRAVDEAMRRIATAFGDGASQPRARIIRYGRQVTPALVESHGEQLVFDVLVKQIRGERMRRSVDIAARYEDRLTELQEVDYLLSAIPLEYEDERARLQRRHRRLKWYIERFDAIVRERVRIFDAAFQRLDGIAQEVLQSCQVLGTTVHQALMSSSILAAQWDCIVIDESSMVPFALAYAVGIRARATLWVAGDPRQLGPVVKADRARARRWLERDVFTTSGSYGEGAQDELWTATFVSRLNQQYRMHPDVCALISPAYGNSLHTDPTVRAKRLSSSLELPFAQKSRSRQQPGLYLLDTSALWPAVCKAAGGSRRNRVHVAVVRALMEILDASALLPQAGHPPDRMAVISPFFAQARWIASVLERRFPGHGIRCDTVHAFQGQEVDLLIVDLTESRGLDLTKWMAARSWSEEGARLLTVALSRCRERCIVIADCNYLYGELERLVPRPVIYTLLRYLEAWGGAIEVEQDVIERVHKVRAARAIECEVIDARAVGSL